MTSEASTIRQKGTRPCRPLSRSSQSGRSANQAKPVAAADRIIIFDTTLRDGEQSPGASMTVPEKVQIALLLEEMGRSMRDIEAQASAIASPGDFQAVHAIAKKVKSSVVCALARASRADIERAAEALEPAERKRIHTPIATSPLHMRVKLQEDPGSGPRGGDRQRHPRARLMRRRRVVL